MGLYKIFLDDMFKNNEEPKIGEQIYKIRSSVRSETHTTPLQNVTSHTVSQAVEKYSKYGGKIDDKTYYTEEGEWSRLWIKNCFIIREITSTTKKIRSVRQKRNYY